MLRWKNTSRQHARESWAKRLSTQARRKVQIPFKVNSFQECNFTQHLLGDTVWPVATMKWQAMLIWTVPKHACHKYKYEYDINIIEAFHYYFCTPKQKRCCPVLKSPLGKDVIKPNNFTDNVWKLRKTIENFFRLGHDTDTQIWTTIMTAMTTTMITLIMIMILQKQP